jgi:hypothetical protein
MVSNHIQREDVVVDTPALPPLSPSTPQIFWPGLSFPDLRHFEELLPLITSPEYQRRFIGVLARATQSPRLRTILILRAEFYHRCVEHPCLAELLRSASFPLAAPYLPALLE